MRELKEAKLVKLKVGAIETSLDSKDYLVSLSGGEWFEKKAKER